MAVRTRATSDSPQRGAIPGRRGLWQCEFGHTPRDWSELPIVKKYVRRRYQFSSPRLWKSDVAYRFAGKARDMRNQDCGMTISRAVLLDSRSPFVSLRDVPEPEPSRTRRKLLRGQLRQGRSPAASGIGHGYWPTMAPWKLAPMGVESRVEWYGSKSQSGRVASFGRLPSPCRQGQAFPIETVDGVRHKVYRSGQKSDIS
jgi:hypothetical protein